tara:strand:- start:419 stop:889 length:471 start_codon:yes stop_codon:yes gene_type:complete
MIYFMQSLNKIKIGYTSNNVAERKRQLETGNPHGIVVIGTVQGSKMHETDLHNSLKEHKIQGEWFEDCTEVRNYIADILDKKRIVKYKQCLYGGGEITVATTEPIWINQFNTFEQVNFKKVQKVIQRIRETEISINRLVGQKKMLDREYIKLIKRS